MFSWRKKKEDGRTWADRVTHRQTYRLSERERWTERQRDRWIDG